MGEQDGCSTLVPRAICPMFQGLDAVVPVEEGRLRGLPGLYDDTTETPRDWRR
jgi:hypothetical protein